MNGLNEFNICLYVDHYVQKIMDYSSSQNERNLVCLEVAPLYYKVGAYDKAISYLKIYLGSSNEAVAHGLMGHCYIRKEPPDLRRGLYHLNRSVQLNPCQPDLIADVSRLLLEHIKSAESYGRNWVALIDQFESTGPLVAALRMRVDPADSNRCSDNSSMRHMERAMMRIQISQELQDKAIQKERESNNRVINEFRKGLRTLKTKQSKLIEDFVKAVGESESLSDDQAIIPQDTAIVDLTRSPDMRISVSNEDKVDRPTDVPAIISQVTPFVQSTESHSSTTRALSKADFADQPLQNKGFIQSTGSQSATGSLQPMSWADLADQQQTMLAESMALYAPTNSRIPVFRADVDGQDKRSMESTGSQSAILTRVPISRADVADQRLKNTPIDDSMVTWAPAKSLAPVFSSDDGPVHARDDQLEVKFSSGAKLYSENLNEKWKVCGTGLVKILRHKATGVSRVLMHRHQTGEILANYQIAHDMTLSPFDHDEDQQSFLWAVNIFADEQLTLKFLIRLAAPKKAEEFQVAFEKAKDEAKPTNALPPKSPWGSFVTSTSQKKEKLKEAADVSLPTAAIPPQASEPLAPSAFANFGNHLFLDGALDGSGTNSPPFNTASNEEDPLEDQSASDATEPEEEQDISDAVDIEIFWSGPQIVDDLVFGDKVELYFFDKAALTWKACGFGYLRVVEHPLVTGLYRLKVRQEETDKLLLNMSVKRSTTIYWNPSMPKTLMWTGTNLVDGEGNITAVGVEERVACSFATEQQALVLLGQLEDGR